MRWLLHAWPKLLIAVILAAMGWTLYEVLPIEPRWRMSWKRDPKSHRVRPEVFWLDSGKRLLVNDWDSVRYVEPKTQETRPLQLPAGHIDGVIVRGGYALVTQIPAYAHGHMFIGRVASAFRLDSREAAWQSTLHSSKSLAFVAPHHLAFNPGNGQSSVIWDLHSNRKVGLLESEYLWLIASDNGERLIAFPPCELWDLSNPAAPSKLGSPGQWFESGAFSADGRHCAVQADRKKIECWDASTLERLWQMRVSQPGTSCGLAFAPNGRRLAVRWRQGPGSGTDLLHMVDVETGALLWENNDIDFYTDTLFTSDCTKLVVKVDKVHVFDVDSGRSLASVPVFPFDLSVNVSPQLSADGRFLLLHDVNDARATPKRTWLTRLRERIFGRKSMTNPMSVIDVETYEEVFYLNTESNHEAYGSLSPDGKMLLVNTIEDDDHWSLICWDIPAARPWRWIIGVPAALGLALVGVGWFRKRWRAKKLQDSGAADHR